jgi:hypothetical protein
MIAFEQLKTFVKDNNLLIWTKDEIPALENLIIITELNRICKTFHFSGIDSEDDIHNNNYPITIGKNNFYFVSHYNTGYTTFTYCEPKEINNFLVENLLTDKEQYKLIDANLQSWIDCWSLIYNLIKPNIKKDNLPQLFETELFNYSINNSIESKLSDNGLKKVFLKLRNPEYKGEYNLQLFFNLKRGIEGIFNFNFNLTVKYLEGLSDYDYKFYYSNDYPEQYTYLNTPDAFMKFFEKNMKGHTIIDTLYYTP